MSPRFEAFPDGGLKGGNEGKTRDRPSPPRAEKEQGSPSDRRSTGST